MELSHVHIGLSTLSVYRDLLDQPVIVALSKLSRALETGDGLTAAQCYSQLFYEMQRSGSPSLGHWLYEALRWSQGPYPTAMAKGDCPEHLEYAAKLDIEAYGRKAAKYVKEKNFSKQANEEMRLYNLTMKVNRLELLKAQIGLEMVAGFDELQKYYDEKLTDRTIAEFERQAGILGKTIQDNAKAANAIVNASFHNATFSDRIWMYQDMLKNELNSLLQTGLIQGQHPRKLAAHLRKRFGVSQSNAERLLITEMARVQTEAQKQSFERNGFEEYTFLALGTACPICRALDGKHFKVSKMMSGTNAPPMHPNCRCSVAAYEDSEDYEDWLDFLSKGGTTEEWNKLKRKSSLKEDDDCQKRIKQRRAAYRNRTQSRSVSSNISDFSSMGREELLDYAKKNLKTDIGDLKGVNIEFARDAIRVLSEFERKMGGNTIKGLKVRFGGLSKSAYAKYDDATKTILLKKSGSKEAFEKVQKEENARYRAKWKRDKDYHATDTYTGTIWHELGHAIDIESNQSLSKRLSSTPELDELSVKISNYAGTTQGVRVSKRSEAWAENFAAYMDGGTNKVKVPKEISDMIENYFKESVAKASGSGIIKGKGSTLKMDLQFFAEKDIKNQQSGSLKRAIRKYQARIEEHEAKIKNPKEIYPEWDTYDPRYQEGLKRHWNKEIRNFKQSIQDRVDELKERGDYDE